MNETLIKSKESLKSVLKYEGLIYGKKHPYVFRPVLSEKNVAWKIVSLLRIHEYHFNCGHKIRAFFYRFLRKLMANRFFVNIPLNVVEPGLSLRHPRNITINAKHVGKNASIQFNVSFVAGGHDHSVPTVGDDVVVGTGSVIIGDVHIANGIAIGANSTVTKSFLEPNICIAGNPAKKISNNGSFSWRGSVRNIVGADK